MMYILDNSARLAKLLASIKTEDVNRPLRPIDVAKEIDIMLMDLGGDQGELVRRLPITQDMIKQFRRLLRLPSEIRGMVVWGKSKHETGGIGFSVATRIATLNSRDDMLMMAGTITEMPRPVTKDEIKRILSLKTNNPGKPLKECLDEVLKVMRPVIITHYIFLSGLNPSIAQAVKRRANKMDKNVHELAAEILRGTFPEGSFKSAKVFSDCIRLSLDKHGSDFIPVYAKSRGISVQEALNHMLGSEMVPDG